METDSFKDLLANVAIILKQPKHPENIGAAARCAMNMGISSLIVVRDEAPDREKMLKMATHHARPIIEGMELHNDLKKALAPFPFVVGTTARRGKLRRSVTTPRAMARHLLPVLQNNRVAIVFGPEDRGLTNEDLKYCNMLTAIPTADFSSLNLAQAVAVHCYELYYGVLETGQSITGFVPRRAEFQEMEGLYAHLEQALRRIRFLRENDYDYWMRNIRSFFGRIGLRAREVRMIRGICRQFLWYEDAVQGKGKTPDP